MKQVDPKRVLDHMKQAIFWKSRDGHYYGVNKVLADLCKTTPENFVGKTDFDFFAKSDAEWYRKCDREVVESGQPSLGIIEPQLREDGTRYWLETSKVPLTDEDGEIIGMLGWFEDISDRKRREDKLAADEEKFRLIVETANEWMWEVDSDGQFTYSSPRVEQLLGVKAEDLIGKKHAHLVAGGDSDSIDQIYKILGQAGEAFSGVRVTYELADGRSVIVESAGVPFKDSEGEIQGLRCVSRDVTQQVEAERDLKEKYELVAAQREAISRLSTPIMQVWDGVLCLPVVGMVDMDRSAEMTDTLLQAVVEKQARCVIVDVTGIEAMDTSTADLFIKMAKAIRLLGAHPVLTGISPGIAQTMANIGVNMTAITTMRTLKDGLEAYLSGALDAFHNAPTEIRS